MPPEQGAPVDPGAAAESLFDAIMVDSPAPEEPGQAEAPPQEARQEPGDADEPPVEGEPEPEEQPEEPPEGEGESVEEDEIEYEGPDGKPLRVKLSDALEAFLNKDKASPKVDEKAIAAQIRQRIESEAAADREVMAKARDAWIKKAEEWSKWTGEPQAPNPDLLDPNSQNYDPDRYHRQRAFYERNKANYDAVQAQIRSAKEKAEHERNKEFKAYKEQEILALSEKWPEFAKDEKVRQAAVEVATKYGYTFDDVAEIVDHRQFLILRDLAAYDAMKSAKGAEAVKKKIAPKLVKAAARTADAKSLGKMPAETRAMLDARKQVKQTGKVTRDNALEFLGPALFGEGKS